MERLSWICPICNKENETQEICTRCFERRDPLRRLVDDATDSLGRERVSDAAFDAGTKRLLEDICNG